jgi:hypothetical protein
MLRANRIITRLFVIFAILTAPLLVVHGSSGSIEGKVTDPKLGTAVLAGSTSVDLSNIKLSMAPKRAAICAMNDVLASSIQNSK